jgi:hypothetical protein
MVAYDPPPRYDHVDSDDESVPPPPPPPPGGGASSGETFEDHELKKSCTSGSNNTSPPVKKWRLLKREAEHVLVPQNEHETQNYAVTDHNDNDDYLVPTNNSNHMQGHFRGIQNAQYFDEEEAGMDDIEVPSSSVVARLNSFQKKQAQKSRACKLGALAFLVVAALIVIITGSVVGSRNKNGGTDAPGFEAEAEAKNPNPLDTEAGVFLLNNNAVPASTKEALKDENSIAAQAFDWVMYDQANAAFGFGEAGALQSEEAQLNFMQRFATASLGKSFDVDSFTNSEGWMTDKDVCEWTGIKCAAVDRTLDGDNRNRNLEIANIVAIIDLNNNNVVGALPAEIAMFTEVTQLILYNNKISGPIPSEIFSMTQLTALDLFNNELTGEISEDFANLVNMIGLYLSENDMSGAIPAALAQMTKLEHLWLEDNQFTGTIPEELGSLTDLMWLLLSGNSLKGGLPESFVNLAALVRLDLDRNTGLFVDQSFPTFLYDLQNLERLSMRSVSLNGAFPVMVKNGLPKLTKLHLDDNLFTGTLPNDTAWLQSLQYLSLSGNSMLGGAAPKTIGFMYELKVLDLSNCRFEGKIPSDGGWEMATKLEEIYINGNYFTGVIPATFADLTSLRVLEFDRNADITDVTEEFCALPALEAVIGGCDVNCDCCTDECGNGN